MSRAIKLNESVRRMQTPTSATRAGQPTQKISDRRHKRATSQQNSIKSNSNIDNQGSLLPSISDRESIDSNNHKRANSRDNLSKWYGRVCYPLVNTSLRKFNRKPAKMMSGLETIEDKDELNSSSI